MSIYPLTICPKCHGTGKDEEAEIEIRKQEPSLIFSRIRCTLCNGEGKY